MQLALTSTLRRAAVPLLGAIVVSAGLVGCSSSSKPSGGTSPTASSSSASASPSAITQPAAANKPPVCPLTGQPPVKGQHRKGIALAVKIDNVSEALPQTAVNSADVVFEELVEGGLTRLMAIFQCSSAPVVGPIRSARISDADVLRLLHGSVLGFSGANPADLPPIVAHSDAALISQDADGQYFYRSSSKAAPHNVFSSTKTLIKAGRSHKHHLKAPRPLFTYGPINAATKAAHSVTVRWSSFTSAEWTWSGGQWLRTQDGAPDKQSNGKQLNATNVVVMSVNIASTGLRDVLGNPSPLDVTVQKKPMPLWVMRGGRVIKGTWTRPKLNAPLRFRTKAGKVLNLAPGRTWVEFLPTPGKPSIARH
jgi:hypothetical protein